MSLGWELSYLHLLPVVVDTWAFMTMFVKHVDGLGSYLTDLEKQQNVIYLERTPKK